MAWRAGGDGRGVLIPELPWKNKQVIVHESASEGGVDGKGRVYPAQPPWYYWSCRCGQSSKVYRQRKLCDIAAHDHERRCDGEKP